jgi:hypothetical protein
MNTAVSSPEANNKVTPAPGSQYYEDLRNLIFQSENYSLYVNNLITGIRKHGIEKPQSFTVTGDADSSQKLIEITENVVAENVTWQYAMVVKDVQTGGIGLQLFWNNNPVKGFAIANEYNINKKLDPQYKNRMIRVDYSELPGTYDASMTLTLTGLTNELNWLKTDMKSFKMSATRVGTIVDFYGNSSDPDFRITETSDQGRQYAFTGRANRSTNLGVVYLGLPPVNYDNRDNVLTDYSLSNVLSAEYQAANIADSTRSRLLSTAGKPAFLNSSGFSSVEKPISGSDSTGFQAINVDLSGLKPYSPKEVTEAQINFY